ncbi:MAG: hypothetical protein QOE93_686 [Actinomycetota bacterium]|jgi:anti-sigma factor RsiW|nr:hypothetical protein [Actinomycetota bacterium]
MARRLRCQEVVELVTDYLDGVLPPATRVRLDDHLRRCRNCAAYLDQVRVMVRALGRLAAPALDRQARADLVEHFRRWTSAA